MRKNQRNARLPDMVEGDGLAQMFATDRRSGIQPAMVSGFDSPNLFISAQSALKAIEEQQTASALSASRTPPSRIQIGTLPASSGSRSIDDYFADFHTQAEEISTDIKTSNFMSGLKTQLLAISRDTLSAFQGKAMLKALEMGTLTVFDPIEGIAISAWEANNSHAVTHQTTNIDASGWRDFLRKHVMRDENAAYAKDENGSYIDIISGESAYFGTVGSKYYYFTWH